jgi:hypothetical protein
VLPSATLKIAASACMKAAACINRPTSLPTLSFCLSHRVSQPHSRLHRKTLLGSMLHVSIAAYRLQRSLQLPITRALASDPRPLSTELCLPLAVRAECLLRLQVFIQSVRLLVYSSVDTISWDEDRSQTTSFFFADPEQRCVIPSGNYIQDVIRHHAVQLQLPRWITRQPLGSMNLCID